VSAAGSHVSQYYERWRARPLDYGSLEDTVIYPLIEMRQLGVGNDSATTQRLIAAAPAGAALTLSTGYFNLTDSYSKCVANSKADFDVLMAHPTANGFLGAKGPAGGIPHAYTLLAHRFRLKLAQLGQQVQKTNLNGKETVDFKFHYDVLKI